MTGADDSQTTRIALLEQRLDQTARELIKQAGEYERRLTELRQLDDLRNTVVKSGIAQVITTVIGFVTIAATLYAAVHHG